MLVELEDIGKSCVGPWLVVKRGRKVMGHDIALWLDERSAGRAEKAA